jgi:hypothetical protein
VYNSIPCDIFIPLHKHICLLNPYERAATHTPKFYIQISHPDVTTLFFLRYFLWKARIGWLSKTKTDHPEPPQHHPLRTTPSPPTLKYAITVHHAPPKFRVGSVRGEEPSVPDPPLRLNLVVNPRGPSALLDLTDLITRVVRAVRLPDQKHTH